MAYNKGFIQAHELTELDKEVLAQNSRNISKALYGMVMHVAAHIDTGCPTWYCAPVEVINYMDSLDETQVRQLLSMAIRTLAYLHANDND